MTASEPDRRQELEVHYKRITTDEYGSRWSLDNLGNQASLAERRTKFERLLHQHLAFPNGRVLDLGCGSASVIPGLEGFDVVGLDLLLDRLRTSDHSAFAGLVNADGCALPFADESFEVVALFTTLSSVTDASVRTAIAQEVERVLRPGGVLIWYDFRYPSPGNRSVVPIHEREIQRLFPTFSRHLQTMTLLPPVARRLGRLTTLGAYRYLSLLAPLRSHIGGILVKPGPGSPAGAVTRAHDRTTPERPPMRFLIVTQYYPPEVGAAQVRLPAVARELQRLGHSVEVVTAMPNYPTGRIFEPYRRRLMMSEMCAGVPTTRVWMFASMGRGTRRMVSYVSFTMTCVLGLAKRRPRPDWVFIESPPLTVAVPGLLYARLRRARSIVNIADLWPDAAQDLGVLHEGRILQLAQRLERWVYRHATVVNAVTVGIERTLGDGRVDPSRLTFLPNGVDIDAFAPTSGSTNSLDLLGLPHTKLIVYTGNMGYSQGLANVIEAMRIVHDTDPEVTMAFIGDGSERTALKSQAAQLGLTNVRFVDPVPPTVIAEILPSATAALVSLLDLPTNSDARPSKMFPAMAAGRPIVFAGLSEGSRIVARADAGLEVRNDDPSAIAAAICSLTLDPTTADRLGANGRRLVEDEFSWTSLVGRWIQQLPN